MALVPVLFNINELIMFGVPIVLNPIYLVPFLCTPLVLTVISYLATLAGLVPVAIHTVEWTTPIFLSGYAATPGRSRGACSQLVNLAVGVGIYLPFVRLAQARQLRSLEKQMERLARGGPGLRGGGRTPALLARGGQLGSMAKLLAEDLRYALRSGGVRLHYQPQTDARGRVWGAEALLRWEHGPAGSSTRRSRSRWRRRAASRTSWPRSSWTRPAATWRRSANGAAGSWRSPAT